MKALAKRVLKQLIPPQTLNAARDAVRVRALYQSYEQVLPRLPQASTGPLPPAAVLIVPSDPGLIIGSKGDDAMVSVVIEQARARDPGCAIGIVCNAAPLPPRLAALDACPEPVWPGADFDGFVQAVACYDTVIVIGADVMDGHFSAAAALRYWMFADLAARLGRRSVVLGCSFKDDPAPALRPLLDRLHPAVDICLRDGISFDHFSRFSQARGRLVADSAFLLGPSFTAPDLPAVQAWAERQRAQGRILCAINLHPMLYERDVARQAACLVESAAIALRNAAARHPVSFLLLPHDFRGPLRSDDDILGPLHVRLQAELGDRLFYARQNCTAAEVKVLAAFCDQLVTARMHLGVGALSMGVPIACVTFQEKFKGLLRHFELPSNLVISPEEALDPARLTALIGAALSGAAANKLSVQANLPKVRALAAENFRILGPACEASSRPR